MRCRLKLTALKSNHNKKLIARRLAADLAMEIHRTESMLSRLPIDILQNAPEDKAKSVAIDYERLGCIVTISKEEESFHIENQAPIPQPPPVSVQPVITQTPVTIVEKPVYSVMSIKKETAHKNIFRRDGIKIVLLVVAAIFSLFIASRCPSIKRTLQKPSSPDSLTVKMDGQKYSDSAIVELEEKIALIEDESEMQSVKDTLALFYSEKADFTPDPENRVKFYRAAISLNENNQAAWEGLIESLIELGKVKEAEEAMAEKRRLFLDVDIALEQMMNSRGPVVGESISRRNTLSFTYRTILVNDFEVQKEMNELYNNLIDIRKYRQINITARRRQKEMTSSWVNGRRIQN